MNTCLWAYFVFVFWHVSTCLWLSGMNEKMYGEDIVHSMLHTVVSISGVPSYYTTHHSPTRSTLCPPLRPHCYLNLLFPALSPVLHERQALLKKKKSNWKLNWACETSHKGKKRVFEIHWALCVSCPKCFLQNRCNWEPGFLRQSLCFWGIMKRGKAQTHIV